MAVTAINFPRSLLRERTGRLELGRRTVSPGFGGSGVLPLIALDGGGLWELDYGAVALTTPDHIRTWEALAAISDGGATPFIVPWCGCVENPVLRGSDGKPILAHGLPHSDGTMFTDGSGHQQPALVYEVYDDQPLRDTQIGIVIRQGTQLRGGEHFTIVHPTAGARLYRVVGIVAELQVDYVYTIAIRPPLREAVLHLTPMDFNDPRCVMQLANPHAMDLTRELRRYGNPSASFIESFP